MTEEELREKMNKDLDEAFNVKSIIDFQFDLLQKAYTKGLETGIEAGKPQWHDLRKDPKDLPKEVGRYIVCYLDTACERSTFELSFVDWFEDKHWIDEDNHNIEGYDEGVVAWCEIPTFDKE